METTQITKNAAGQIVRHYCYLGLEVTITREQCEAVPSQHSYRTRIEGQFITQPGKLSEAVATAERYIERLAA